MMTFLKRYTVPCVWLEGTNGNNQQEVDRHAVDPDILPILLLSLLTRKERLHGWVVGNFKY